MASSLLFGIALLVVIIGGILLIFKFARKAIKWVLIALAVIIIASTLLGVNLFKDVRDLQENFPKTQKLLLLKDGNTLLTGFEGKLFSLDGISSFVSKEQLDQFQESYSVRDIQRMRENYFKMIIFDTMSFDGLGVVLIEGENMVANDVIDMIKASDTLTLAVTQAIEKDNLPDTQATRNFLVKAFNTKGISSDEDMRAFLFEQLFSSATSKDPLFLISEFKNNNIVVYPETITFKLAKIIPTTVLQDTLKKLVNEA